MGHAEFDPPIRESRSWNAGRMVGAKRALKPQQVWVMRFWLDRERRLRDRVGCWSIRPTIAIVNLLR